MEQPNQSGDGHDSQRYRDPGGAATNETPSEWQQDELECYRRTSAPPPAQEYPSGYEKEQEAEPAHQNRHANSNGGT